MHIANSSSQELRSASRPRPRFRQACSIVGIYDPARCSPHLLNAHSRFIQGCADAKTVGACRHPGGEVLGSCTSDRVNLRAKRQHGAERSQPISSEDRAREYLESGGAGLQCCEAFRRRQHSRPGRKPSRLCCEHDIRVEIRRDNNTPTSIGHGADLVRGENCSCANRCLLPKSLNKTRDAVERARRIEWDFDCRDAARDQDLDERFGLFRRGASSLIDASELTLAWTHSRERGFR